MSFALFASLHKKSVGIDIADRTIEVAELSGNKILNLSRVRFGAGVVEHGRIKDEKKLEEIVKKVLAEAKPETIKTDEIIFLLPESQVFIHHADLNAYPAQAGRGSKRGSLEEFIKLEVLRNIPLSEEDLVYGYKEIIKTKDKKEFLIVATDREVLQEWQQFFAKLKMEVWFFDIEMLAAFRALGVDFNREIPSYSGRNNTRNNAESKIESVMLIDIGSVTTNIAIFDKSGLQYSYAVQAAGEKFTQDLANELKIDLTKAEEKKKTIDLKSGDKTANILIKSLEYILSEIKKSINYYQQTTKQKISQVILIGGSSKIKGLIDYLSSNLEIKVSVGSPALRDSNAKLVYLGAIGAALRGSDWDNDPMITLKHENIKTLKQNKKQEKHSAARSPEVSPPREQTATTKEPEVQNGSRKKLIFLFIILFIGIILIGGAFWYRNYKKSQFEKIKKQAQEVEIEIPESVATTTPEVVEPAEIYLLIKDTPTDFLNVREGPGTDFEVIVQVKPGEKYLRIDQDTDWYKIKISSTTEGWVYFEYVDKLD